MCDFIMSGNSLYDLQQQIEALEIKLGHIQLANRTEKVRECMEKVLLLREEQSNHIACLLEKEAPDVSIKNAHAMTEQISQSKKFINTNKETAMNIKQACINIMDCFVQGSMASEGIKLGLKSFVLNTEQLPCDTFEKVSEDLFFKSLDYQQKYELLSGLLINMNCIKSLGPPITDDFPYVNEEVDECHEIFSVRRSNLTPNLSSTFSKPAFASSPISILNYASKECAED